MTAHDGERPPPKKRRRVVVSCTECHRRKQKCDRQLPCANCLARSKADACAYDDGAPTAKNRRRDAAAVSSSRSGDEGGDDENGGRGPEPQTLSSRAADLGYSQAGASSMGLLKRIESAHGGEDADVAAGSGAGSSTLAARYKALVRQLPGRPLLRRLVELYFRHFHWTYCFLEEVLFREQLAAWEALPHAALARPLGLPAEMRALPGLLFQVAGLALLVLADEEDAGDFAGLRYSADMSWADLAREYSENGMAVLRLFGKRHLALTTVEAQMVRALCMKYSADVAESWHSLAGAVRDAQELGLHTDALDPRPRDASLESVLRTQWEIQVRRKLYMIVMMWDVSCAMILGRPALMDWRSAPSLPVDVEVPPDREHTPIIPRNPAKDPPTRFTRVLWLHQMMVVLRDIYHLEQEGPFPKDFTRVAKLQDRIDALEDQQPAFYRLRDPDTRWDTEERRLALQDSRFYFAQMASFLSVALHRSYIFHRRASRDAALAACLRTLACHRAIFADLPVSSWRNYILFFGSFDAIVMVASVFIMFPAEQPEHRDAALRHFRWTIERFSVMQTRNPLARSALGVLRAVLGRFLRALGCTDPAAREVTRDIMTGAAAAEAAAASTSVTPDTAEDSTPSSVLGGKVLGTTTATTATARSGTAATSSGFTPCTQSPLEGTNRSRPPPSGLERPGAVPDMVPPAHGTAGEPLLSMPPLLATSDLVWNDLNALGAGDAVPPGDDFAFDPNVLDWQFGGEFGHDSVWGYLNQCQPGQPWPGPGAAKSEEQTLA